jgi:hypothetical protein
LIFFTQLIPSHTPTLSNQNESLLPSPLLFRTPILPTKTLRIFLSLSHSLSIFNLYFISRHTNLCHGVTYIFSCKLHLISSTPKQDHKENLDPFSYIHHDDEGPPNTKEAKHDENPIRCRFQEAPETPPRVCQSPRASYQLKR